MSSAEILTQHAKCYVLVQAWISLFAVFCINPSKTSINTWTASMSNQCKTWTSYHHFFVHSSLKWCSVLGLEGLSRSWVDGGVGGGGRGWVTSYIRHSMDVRAEWPPFSALPGIWLAPFFQQKVYEWTDFSGFLCERPHFSDIHIFRSESFRGCLFSWYSIFSELTVISVWQPAINGYKKSKGSIWIGQHFRRWGRFWNTGSHTPTTITPVIRTPPPPRPPAHLPTTHRVTGCFTGFFFSRKADMKF